MSARRFAWVLLSLAAALPGVARASCAELPAATCAPEGISLCTHFGVIWICDFAPYATETAPVSATLVTHGTATSGVDPCSARGSCVWGQDAHGNDFCCESGSNPFEVINDLSDGADTFATSDPATGARYDTGTSSPVTVEGYGGDDVISGNSSTNAPMYVAAGDGADLLIGSAAHDELYGEGGHDTVVGGAGNDLLSGDQGADLLNGEVGVDEVRGGDGVDLVCGGPEADALYGGLGNDQLDGMAGADTLDGEAGTDECGNDARVGCEGPLLTPYTCPVSP